MKLWRVAPLYVLSLVLAHTTSQTTYGTEPFAAQCLVTFVVTTPLDETDLSPGDGLCETQSGHCSLRAAIQESNEQACAGLIELGPNIYGLAIAGVGEDAALSGDLDISNDLTIQGSSPTETIIDGGLLDRVIDVTSDDAKVTLLDLTVRNGQTENQGFVDGGGIRGRGTVLLENVHVVQNRAGDDGGGIWQTSGSLSLHRTLVAENTAFDEGGGIYFFSQSLQISQATFADNRAGNRGGAVESGGRSETEFLLATVTNSTFSGNQANRGGAWNLRFFGSLDITYSTIVDNVANAGGGLRTGSSTATITAGSSILANNSTQNCTGLVSSTGNNLDSGTSCNFNTISDLTMTDPDLGPLADNGGPTPTHALPSTSPTVDAGDLDACPITDQRGIPRPDGSGCDIGAFEAEINEPPVALCQDIVIPADPVSCTSDASIDSSSFDPDGDTLTLEQVPPGPYSSCVRQALQNRIGHAPLRLLPALESHT